MISFRIRKLALLAVPVISLALANTIAAQDAFRDILGYEAQYQFSGAQTLSADGSFVHQEGSGVSIGLRPVAASPTGGDPKREEIFELSGTVISANSVGAIIRLEGSGLCAVFLLGQHLIACQTPPVGGTRALTMEETEWVEWNGRSIDENLASVADQSPEERLRAARVFSMLPSSKAGAFVAQLAAELGHENPEVIAVLATWETTSKIIGIDTEGLADKLFAAVETGDNDKLIAAFAEGASANMTDGDGQSAINLSIANRDIQIVATLLEHGAEYDWADSQLLNASDNALAELIRMLATVTIVRQEIKIADLTKSAEINELQRTALEKQLNQLKREGDALDRTAEAEVIELRERLDQAEEKAAEWKLAAIKALNLYKNANDEDSQRTKETLQKLQGLIARTQALGDAAYRHEKSVSALELFVDTTTPEIVSYVQNRLIEFSYDPGSADGKMGEKTREAIREFQRAAKLPVTGEITPRMISLMAADAD